MTACILPISVLPFIRPFLSDGSLIPNGMSGIIHARRVVFKSQLL